MDKDAAEQAARRLLAYCNARFRVTGQDAEDLGVSIASPADEAEKRATLDAALAREPWRQWAFGVSWNNRGRLMLDQDEPSPGFLQAWNTREGAAATEEELAAVWGTWGEHPTFPHKDWHAEAEDNETSRGYWAWVEARLERMRNDGGAADDVPGDAPADAFDAICDHLGKKAAARNGLARKLPEPDRMTFVHLYMCNTARALDPGRTTAEKRSLRRASAALLRGLPPTRGARATAARLARRAWEAASDRPEGKYHPGDLGQEREALAADPVSNPGGPDERATHGGPTGSRCARR